MPTGDTKKSKVLLVSSVTQPQPKLTKDKETPPTATLKAAVTHRGEGASPPATAAGQSLLEVQRVPSLGGGVGHTPEGSRVEGGTASQWPRARSVQTGREDVPRWKIGDRGPLQATPGTCLQTSIKDCSLQQLRIHPKAAMAPLGSGFGEVYGSSLTG